MITVLATIFVLGVLIFIHEVGHFSVAKMFRIRVDRFSMGLPPILIKKKIGETDYCISAIPFGGYVKIAGMVDESLDKKTLSEEPKPWEYRSRPWIQKALVILAGPLMNVGFAFVVFVVLAMTYGVENTSHVGSVLEGKPADRAGMRPGDLITNVDGVEVTSWEELTKVIHGAPGKTVRVEWMRNDLVFVAEMTTAVEKMEIEDEIREIGLIGIGPKAVGAGRAFVMGGGMIYGFTKLVLVSIYKVITREASVRSFGGPIIIAKMAGESARSGLGTLFLFMAFLSLNLGILNLLPIPVLDGGHMLFLSIEGILRRQIPQKLKLIVQQIFMFLLLGFMLFIIYIDILRVIHK